MLPKYMCEACEQAPAAIICKADAASLCVTCDELIHSANPLSRRHHRVPVMPISSSIYGVESRGGILTQESTGTIDNEDEDDAASWLLFETHVKNGLNQNGETNGFLFNGRDEYLDLVEYNSCQDNQFSDDHEYNDLQFGDKYMNDVINKQQRYEGGDTDSMVPVRFGEEKKPYQHNLQKRKFELRMEYETSNGGYGYPASLGHSVSMSSLDVGVGVVPDSSISKASRSPKGTIDLFSSYSVEMPTQLTPIDRKARVQRYMEKKKTRKLEKTIRYASRKAYAESRPRIKGRFAKRTNVDSEVDQMFSTTLMTEGGYSYCIAPSFYK